MGSRPPPTPHREPVAIKDLEGLFLQVLYFFWGFYSKTSFRTWAQRSPKTSQGTPIVTPAA